MASLPSMSEQPRKIEFVQFSLLSEETIKRLSVAEIKRPSTGATRSTYETPSDPRMGPLENDTLCDTCQFDNMKCPGHIGHIKLPCPVAINVCSQLILRTLQSVCSECGRSRILPEHARLKIGDGVKGFNRLKSLSEKGKKVQFCPWEGCGKSVHNFIKPKGKNFERVCEGQKTITFTSRDILDVFLKISEETASFLGFNAALSSNNAFIDEVGNHIHANHPRDMVFTVLPVIPPCARPHVVKDGQVCDDDLTEKYNAALKIIVKLENKAKKKLTDRDREELMEDLKNHIWTLIMNEGTEQANSTTKRPHKSITDRLKGKEGQLQTNIAGKRVDFTARTVIVGGGIYLKCDEVGVPKRIANELTFPEEVAAWNLDYYQNLVSLGQINKIERLGMVTRLDQYPDHGRKRVLRVGDKIDRQLRDGDIIVINRQPSLRTEAKKGVIVKIIEGDAMRLPEWMTKSFNADYDGGL